MVIFVTLVHSIRNQIIAFLSKSSYINSNNCNNFLQWFAKIVTGFAAPHLTPLNLETAFSIQFFSNDRSDIHTDPIPIYPL